MKNSLPIIFVGNDYDDFSIFSLAVQEINQIQKVLWLQCPQSLLNNPIPASCIVVDVPARWTPVELDLQMIGKHAEENTSTLFIYTSDPEFVEPRLKDVRIAAIVPKYVQFELLVDQLRKLLCACLN